MSLWENQRKQCSIRNFQDNVDNDSRLSIYPEAKEKNMKFSCIRLSPALVSTMIALLLFFFCCGTSVFGADPETPQMKVSQKSVEDETAKKPRGFRMMAYKPPKRGTPGGRIGGGTRGEGEEIPVLSVLAPDHTGLTTKAQPELYWYVSNPTGRNVEFTLNLEQAGKTLAHKNIKGVREEGIWRIRLSDLGVTLSPDTEYTWFVAMVLDPDQPSTDVFSGGTIMRVRPSGTLEGKLAGAKESDIPAIYAAEGIWYEALASLSRLIENDPENKALRMQRAKLLEQVQLEGEAGLDRKVAGNGS